MSSSSADRPESTADARLVDRAAAGDRAALDLLLREHQSRILAICQRMLGNPTDAQDAAQEAMLAICRGLPRFDRRSAFSTWAYRVTTNACLDELRRRGRRPITDGRVPDRPDLAHSEHADVVAARLTVDAALATLSPEYRAALVLRDLCALDYAEIADVLDIPPGTVRSRIARARAALAGELGNQHPTTERPTSRP